MNQSRRPLVLTQRGHAAAVVLGVEEYERMVEEIELSSDVSVALQQIESGKGVSNREAKAKCRSSAKSSTAEPIE